MAVDIIARAMAAKANSGGGNQPDLSNYVQFDNYPSNEKAGVVKSHINGFQVNENGNPNAAILSKEQYDTIENQYFIGKGTLENIKDDYVGSSQPVQDLTATVTNVQNDQDESMPKQTASGEMITVDDAIAYKTFNVTVDGASEQETTTGANLLNYLKVKQFVSNGLLSIINNDGSITTTGTPTTNYVPILESINITDMLEDGQTYTIMQKNATNKLYIQVTITTNSDEISYIGLNNNTLNIKTFTVDKQNNKKYSINIQSNTIETTGDLNITNHYQLLKGSYDEWQPFEKYTGGQPSPSPDYPQEITTLTFDKITRRGKNYLNIEDGSQTINGVTVTKNNGKITVNGTATNTCFFTISKSIDNFRPGKYVLSANNSKTLNNNQNLLRIMKEDNIGYLDSTITNFSKINNTTIFNITSDDDVNNGHLLLRIDTGTILDNFVFYPQLEPGSQATEPEPYQATEYAIDLQGNEMVELPNGVKDELVIDKQGNVSLIKNVGKVVFDGSEDEYWTNTYGTNLFDLQDYFNSQNQFIPQAIALSNYYIYNSAQSSMNNNLENGEFALQKAEIPMGTVYNIFFKNNSCSTVDEWKAWLQEHNTIIYYPLATPKVIPLGTLSELITTLNGTNNIFINGNIPTTISITYALDIKKYIDNKLAEISAQLIKGE